jgi:hypothetical protein
MHFLHNTSHATVCVVGDGDIATLFDSTDLFGSKSHGVYSFSSELRPMVVLTICQRYEYSSCIRNSCSDGEVYNIILVQD